MNFGLLFEMQRPYEGNDIDWNTLYKETLDQCELADQVGFDRVWFVEHHFLLGFSGSPCPEVIFGALSQRTKNIRIGFGGVDPSPRSPRPHRRTGRDGGPAYRRARRVWHRALERLRAGGPRSRSQRHAATCGRSLSPCCRRSGRPRTSFPGRASSGTSRHGACFPSWCKNHILIFTWPAHSPPASTSPHRKASVCCHRPPTRPRFWPTTSRPTRKTSRRRNRLARS